MSKRQSSKELYRDGCQFHDHCLSCWLEKCQFDMSPRELHELKRSYGMVLKYDRQVLALLQEGYSAAEVAERVQVTQRTVYRIQARAETGGSNDLG